MGRGFLFRPVLGSSRPPEPRTGARYTKRLTPRAARKIKGAAIKAEQLGLGLLTFMTFTCDLETRSLIASGEIVLGREMKRTLNAIQERFRREGYEDFAYMWVAENPGDANPHVHLLTNHRVARSEFDDFAAWVEGLWGHGWVKIERIREPRRAGHYMLKAVGYSAKGEDGEQGTVYGNRYGISRNIAIREETIGIEGCETAAQVVVALGSAIPEDEGVQELAEGVYLTRHGIAFGAGTSDERIAGVVADLNSGAVPD